MCVTFSNKVGLKVNNEKIKTNHNTPFCLIGIIKKWRDWNGPNMMISQEDIVLANKFSSIKLKKGTHHFGIVGTIFSFVFGSKYSINRKTEMPTAKFANNQFHKFQIIA